MSASPQLRANSGGAQILDCETEHGLFSVALQAYSSAFFDWDEYLRREPCSKLRRIQGG
jgi:hypothetical protein